jgi:hypothetical protein
MQYQYWNGYALQNLNKRLSSQFYIYVRRWNMEKATPSAAFAREYCKAQRMTANTMDKRNYSHNKSNNNRNMPILIYKSQNEKNEIPNGKRDI